MASQTESTKKKSQKKNEELNQQFVETFCMQVETAILDKPESDRPVRLFCQDESRFGILPYVQRRITSCGVKPVAEVDPKYDWFYLYGAVEPKTGEGVFLELPRLTGDCFQLFLNHLSANFSKSLNIVVLDNGRFHHASSLVIPDNVVLIFLPPYSPELNPIERLWQDIKARLFSESYQTLEQMQQKLSEILLKYSTSAIAQLTSFSYFLNTANAI